MNIQKHLSYSDDQYQELKLDYYLKWCSSFVINFHNSYQAVVANREMSDFFNNQWEACEKLYDEAIKIYKIDDVSERQLTFKRCLVQLHNKYPKGLVHQASTLKIEN